MPLFLRSLESCWSVHVSPSAVWMALWFQEHASGPDPVKWWEELQTDHSLHTQTLSKTGISWLHIHCTPSPPICTFSLYFQGFVRFEVNPSDVEQSSPFHNHQSAHLREQSNTCKTGVLTLTPLLELNSSLTGAAHYLLHIQGRQISDSGQTSFISEHLKVLQERQRARA